MELHELLNNLNSSEGLIAQYADLDFKAAALKFRVQNYNRKKLFNFLSLLPALMLIYLPIRQINFKTNMIHFLAVSVTSFIVLKYGIFALLDYFKRKSLRRDNLPELMGLIEEMNRVADQLDTFTMLPPKYRTLHAVHTINSYINNQRIDNLKDGLNLYEEELFKMQQVQKQDLQIQQNFQMIQQNKEMIRVQKVTNRLLLWSR